MIVRAVRILRSRWARRQWLPSRPRRPGRNAAVALVGAVLATAVVGGLAQVRVDTRAESLLPAGDPAWQAMQEKARSFGGDPVVVLLESGKPRQLLLDGQQLQRLVRLEGSLSRLPDVAEVYGPGTVLNQTATGAQHFLAQVSGRRDALRNAAEQRARGGGKSEHEVAAAGEAALTGFDRRYGSLLVQAMPAGLPTLHNTKFVETVIFDEAGEPRSANKALVPSPDTVAILVRPRADLDQAGTERLVDAVANTVRGAELVTNRFTITGVPAITAALAERAQRELPVLGAVALVAVALLYLLVPWISRRRARLRPLLAAVLGTAMTLSIFGWSGRPLSLGVVAFLPILLGIGSDFPLYLAQPAHRRRVLVAALAGAAGFGSLALSPLPFVRELGLALALGIVLTVAVALVLRRWFDVAEPADTGPRWAVGPPSRASWRIRLPALVAAVVVAALGWSLLPRVGIEARPERLAQGLPALEQAEYAERVLGASGEINIVLRADDVLTPAALGWVRHAEDLIARQYGDRIHPITSPASLLRFLGPDPTPEQITAGMQLLPSYLTSAVVRPDRQMAVMVFGIELQDLEQQRAMLAGLQAVLPPPPPGSTATVVGLPVAAVRGHELISDGRVATNALGIGLAGLVLLVGLRRRADAGRAVLTVLLATGWVLVVAWVLSGSLSPLTVAVGALTTATGCEFAVMLADAYRRRRAWLLRSVGLAAAAAIVGYLVLTASNLTVLREFGLLLSVSVVLSCAAAVLVVRLLLPPGQDNSAPAIPAERRTAAAMKELTW